MKNINKKFAVYHTGKPYSTLLVEDDFIELSQHETLQAAKKRVDFHCKKMYEACGSHGWDDHFTVMPLQNTKMRTTSTCAHCGTTITFTWVWETNTLNPNHILPCACEYMDNNRYPYEPPSMNTLRPIIDRWARKNKIKIISINQPQ